MILSDGDSIDDKTECDGDCVESRECDSESAGDTALDDDCCNEVDTTDNCFHWKGKDIVE